ncbi:hypothetical protein [Zymobacter sp. IVIA_12111.31 C1]|uniref:hypothetical protein n=1 Tax=Zymobacter sp. IVIA_12111.31 C1 TaxID=3394854 RepID=UPI0039C363A8
MSAAYTLLRRTCIALPMLLSLAACSHDTPPTKAQVQQAMENSANDFVQQAYLDALQAHDLASVRSIISQTDYAITVTDVAKCVADNTEEDTSSHWQCHVKGDITLNGHHYPIDHDIDFYHNLDERTWQMNR